MEQLRSLVAQRSVRPGHIRQLLFKTERGEIKGDVNVKSCVVRMVIATSGAASYTRIREKSRKGDGQEKLPLQSIHVHKRLPALLYVPIRLSASSLS